jgi:hypothetical protein
VALRNSIVSIVQKEIRNAQLKPTQPDDKSLKITLNSETNKTSD